VTAANPTHYIWWLASRASGIVAVTLISTSVLLGLAMAARLVPARRKRGVVALHQHLAMVALVAIALHGASLLGDGWLRPGLAGITIPFALHYRPAFTGAGIIAGYIAVLLGPTFYLRRRIGARAWRRLHRVTPLIWMLALVHTLGSGSDASSVWLRCVVLTPVPAIVYVFAMRIFAGLRRVAVGRQAGEARSPQAYGVSGHSAVPVTPSPSGGLGPPTAMTSRPSGPASKARTTSGATRTTSQGRSSRTSSLSSSRPDPATMT
jgi:sulfoxide reductase heme-binding subunit YedZ